MNEPTDDNVYNCDDKDLESMMQRLFDEGHESVEIMHPTEGRKVITRDEFYALKAAIGGSIKSPSPANALKERNRLKNLANKKQIRHRTAMITADVREIDVDNGKFGCDIDGNDLNVDGMVFTTIEDYLPGIDLVSGEIGCFIDEDGNRPPVRVKSVK